MKISKKISIIFLPLMCMTVLPVYAAVTLVNCPTTVTCTKDNDLSSCSFDGDHTIWQINNDVGFQPPKGTYYFAGASAMYNNGMNDWIDRCEYLNSSGGSPMDYVNTPESYSAPHPYYADSNWRSGDFCASMADPSKCPFQVGDKK